MGRVLFSSCMSHPLRSLLPNASAASRVESTLPIQHRAKRAATAAACEACRKRKSKCSAERPRCSVCVERQTTCEYTTLPTETHLKAQKRKLTDLEIRCQAYEDLFSMLQSRPDDETTRILQWVRTGDDVQRIVRAVEEGDLLLQLSLKPEYRFRYEFPYIREMPAYLGRLQNPYLESILYDKIGRLSSQPPISPEMMRDTIGEHQKMYLVPYHAVELAEPRILSIDVSSWTTVSSDNPMLRVLLAVYFLFEFPFHPYFHKDLFLDDMLRGSREFCSPLLVNAVLAAAWHGYSRAKHRAKYWLPNNFGYRFLSEARRLFELEHTNPAITTVQAAAIINLTCNSNGIDEISWYYMNESLEMAQELDLFCPRPEQSVEWQLAAATTAWCLFNWQAFATFHHFQPPIIKDPPQIPLPGLEDADTYCGEIFVLYPLSREPLPIRNGITFRVISNFRVIMNDINKALHGSPKSTSGMSLDAALGFRSRLRVWYEDLPEALVARNIALPSHLKVHIHYHILLISLFEPFERMGYVHENINPSDIIAESKACFETLVRIYYLRHGFELYDAMFLQFLHMLGFSALRDVLLVENSSLAHEAMRSTLVLCAKGLWDQGRNCYVAEVVFLLFRQSMNLENAGLLHDISDLEESEDLLDRMVQEIRSQWPIGMFSSTKETVSLTLNQFIRWWQKCIQDMAVNQDSSAAVKFRDMPRYGTYVAQN
ncbi:hypothetical protein F5B20DRAFT_364446 [Whalleya microplaca]|nr:hypothetical protein F5B20DRAFT_364446 [Whalleya microplaca]